jgi:hypothetical protein
VHIFGSCSGGRGVHLELDLGRPCESRKGLEAQARRFAGSRTHHEFVSSIRHVMMYKGGTEVDDWPTNGWTVYYCCTSMG